MFDDCIIMAGGSGTRLWPASNAKTPKQFLAVPGGKSFFTLAVERGLAVIPGEGDGRVIIIAGEGHVPQVIAACAALPEADRRRLVLIPEPAPRNTAPAIACGAFYADRVPGEGRRVLVLTSDHIISPLEVFAADADAAAALARGDQLIVFGIPPQGPETGYGYIEAGVPLPIPGEAAPGELGEPIPGEPGLGEAAPEKPGLGEAAPREPGPRDGRPSPGTGPKKPAAFRVRSFREKPPRDLAERFLAAGNFYWNSGMFGFNTRFIREEFRRHAPEVFASFAELPLPGEGAYRLRGGIRVLEAWEGLAGAYRGAPAISFDYAVAEHSEKTAMVAADFSWLDVGSWDEYARLLGTGSAEVYETGTTGCFVDSDIPVALCGVQDLIVVVRSGKDGGPPSALIAKRGATQGIRDIVEQIKAADRGELL